MKEAGFARRHEGTKERTGERGLRVCFPAKTGIQTRRRAAPTAPDWAPAFAGEQGTIRFEKAFGLKAGTLMRMQSAHELAVARVHEDETEVERVAA